MSRSVVSSATAAQDPTRRVRQQHHHQQQRQQTPGSYHYVEAVHHHHQQHQQQQRPRQSSSPKSSADDESIESDAVYASRYTSVCSSIPLPNPPPPSHQTQSNLQTNKHLLPSDQKKKQTFAKEDILITKIHDLRHKTAHLLRKVAGPLAVPGPDEQDTRGRPRYRDWEY